MIGQNPLRPYRQPVLDVLDAGGRPGRVLDRKLLVPIADLAFKQDFIVVSNGDAYVLGFDFGTPFQGRFDLHFYVVGLRMRHYLDIVDDTAHPRQPSDIALGAALLIVPVDFAGQSHQPSRTVTCIALAGTTLSQDSTSTARLAISSSDAFTSEASRTSISSAIPCTPFTRRAAAIAASFCA